MKITETQSAQSDTQLWIQLKNGSELALGKLVKKFFNPLQNYGYKFIKDEDFVKDCVQEIFIEIWQRRERLSVPDSVKAYLLSSVRKRVLREGYRQQILKGDDEKVIENEPSQSDFSAEWAIIEEESLQEITEKVKDSLGKLPKRQQEVLYLQYYQGLSREEIAEIMDINTQSVSNLIQTAFKSFRQNWEGIVILICWLYIFRS